MAEDPNDSNSADPNSGNSGDPTYNSPSDGGWNREDTKGYESWKGEEPSSGHQISEAWHTARDDAQNDPRSSDPNDLGYTGDWNRDN